MWNLFFTVDRSHAYVSIHRAKPGAPPQSFTSAALRNGTNRKTHKAPSRNVLHVLQINGSPTTTVDNAQSIQSDLFPSITAPLGQEWWSLDWLMWWLPRWSDAFDWYRWVLNDWPLSAFRIPMQVRWYGNLMERGGNRMKQLALHRTTGWNASYKGGCWIGADYYTNRCVQVHPMELNQFFWETPI